MWLKFSHMAVHVAEIQPHGVEFGLISATCINVAEIQPHGDAKSDGPGIVSGHQENLDGKHQGH
jgi:hypothetical protein